MISSAISRSIIKSYDGIHNYIYLRIALVIYSLGVMSKSIIILFYKIYYVINDAKVIG